MEYVVIEVKPWAGRYELPLDEFKFTNREWGWIRRWTDYLPATVRKGLTGADAELLAALAVIALCRAGKVANDDVDTMFERFEEEHFGAFTLAGDTIEEEPPDPPSSASSNGNATRSGDDSTTGSATRPAGNHGSATSESPPAASLT